MDVPILLYTYWYKQYVSAILVEILNQMIKFLQFYLMCNFFKALKMLIINNYIALYIRPNPKPRLLGAGRTRAWQYNGGDMPTSANKHTVGVSTQV